MPKTAVGLDVGSSTYHLSRRSGGLLGSKAVGNFISCQYKSSAACWKDQNLSSKAAKSRYLA
jgi:hypothetical protein